MSFRFTSKEMATQTFRIASIAAPALGLAAFAADTINGGVNQPLTGPFTASGGQVVKGIVRRGLGPELIADTLVRAGDVGVF